MLNIEQTMPQDRSLRTMTGFNRKAFAARLPTFSALYEQTLLEPPWQRAVDAKRDDTEQKADNRALSQFHVMCEKAFAGVKR